MSEMTVSALSPDDSAVPEAIVLRAEKITKVFPGTVALDSVDFNVYRESVAEFKLWLTNEDR